MTDYFELVPRTALHDIRPYTVETATDGTVTVRPPSGGRAMVFELVFNTLDARDLFMASNRTRALARACGGSLTILTPIELITSGDTNTEQGDNEHLKSVDIARSFGLTDADVRTGFRLAWRAAIDWYQQQR